LTTSKSYPMTMGFDDDGEPTTAQTEAAVETVEDRMELEETTEVVVGNMEKNAGSTSLQNEAARSARTSTTTTVTATGTKTSTTTTTTTTTGMKKIDEEDEEEEEEILGMKTRNWRKINLSFTVVLDGKDGEDIRAPDQKEGNNDNKMKHHPIMLKIAKFM
jgi:hypothetical protein